MYLKCFCLHPSLYLLVSWACRWDWPLTWLTNHHPSVLWHCWLGHLTRKIVSEMTYNVSSGTLNTTILLCLSFILSLIVLFFLCLCVQDYWKSNQPTSLKVGIYSVTGATNRKNWLSFGGDPVPDTDSGWLLVEVRRHMAPAEVRALVAQSIYTLCLKKYCMDRYD